MQSPQNETPAHNTRVRQDWQKIKQFITNRDHLLVFIAISVFLIDFVIIVALVSPDNKKPANSAPGSAQVAADKDKSTEATSTDSADSNCNVMGINLHGDVVTYIPKTDYNSSGALNVDETASEDIYFAVKNAEKDDKIKAIILEVDSGGGDPVGGEEIAAVLKSSSKPVVAYIRSVGASAAYWGATGASRIFAAKTSEVGSIGVTESYLDYTKSNEKDGYTFHQLSMGKFKDATNKNKPLTAEEKALVMKDVSGAYDIFVQTVADNRHLDVSRVREMATGWAFLGDEALKMGLIDQIGGLDEAKAYLKDNVLQGQEADVCW